MITSLRRYLTTPPIAAAYVYIFLLPLAHKADAHAIVMEANPAAKSTITGPDVKIKLRFNSRIDQRRSRLLLRLPNGSVQTIPIGAVDSPDTLSGFGTGLINGAYVLKWQVLANDGHITNGEIPFEVHAP